MIQILKQPLINVLGLEILVDPRGEVDLVSWVNIEGTPVEIKRDTIISIGEKNCRKISIHH